MGSPGLRCLRIYPGHLSPLDPERQTNEGLAFTTPASLICQHHQVSEVTSLVVRPHLKRLPSRADNRRAKTVRMVLHGTTAALSPPAIPFIVSHNVEKADSATRKFIRSHVMRGKKQKRDAANKKTTATKSDPSRIIRLVRVQMEDLPSMYTQQIPIRVGSDASCLHVCDEIAPPTIMNIVKGSRLKPLPRQLLTKPCSFASRNEDHLSPGVVNWVPRRRRKLAVSHQTGHCCTPHHGFCRGELHQQSSARPRGQGE